MNESAFLEDDSLIFLLALAVLVVAFVFKPRKQTSQPQPESASTSEPSNGATRISREDPVHRGAIDLLPTKQSEGPPDMEMQAFVHKLKHKAFQSGVGLFTEVVRITSPESNVSVEICVHGGSYVESVYIRCPNSALPGDVDFARSLVDTFRYLNMPRTHLYLGEMCLTEEPESSTTTAIN